MQHPPAMLAVLQQDETKGWLLQQNSSLYELPSQHLSSAITAMTRCCIANQTPAPALQIVTAAWEAMMDTGRRDYMQVQGLGLNAFLV